MKQLFLTAVFALTLFGSLSAYAGGPWCTFIHQGGTVIMCCPTSGGGTYCS